nr:SusC/RagA family TonB-linked outer membrane protein [Pseudopedobacter sp.]
MKKLFYISIFWLLVSGTLLAQQKPTFPIRGVVVDAITNQPIAGALVRLPQQNKSSKTDVNGQFTIAMVAESDSLLVSALGYLTDKRRVSRETSFLNIVLYTAAVNLQEVVVSTGYQELKSNEITGSVAVVSEKMLQQQTSPNILDRLDGVTSGLTFSKGKSNGNPQNNTNITIRGLSTINGPLDPLIVLDGFIYEGDITNINPEEIQNVTVLKDAAAASIWGARAGNGVIVITSKKGHYNQALTTAFFSTLSLTQKADLMGIPQMSSADYIAIEKQLFDAGYFNAQINGRPYEALTPAVAIFQDLKAGKISSSEASARIEALKQQDVRQQYADNFYTAPLTQQYGLSLRGGNAEHAYAISLGYLNAKGSNYQTNDRINLRLNEEFQPVRNLKLTAGLTLTSSNSQSGRPAYGSFSVLGRFPPYLSFTDNTGREVPLATAYSKNYTDTLGGGKLLDWNYYPLQEYLHQQSEGKTQEIYAQTGLFYQVLPFLNASVQYQYQQQKGNVTSLSDEQSYFARNLVNSYSQINSQTGVVNYIVPPGGIYSFSDNNISSYTLRGQLNFRKDWKSHRILSIIGAEQRQVKSTSSGDTFYGYQQDPLSYQQIDPINAYPNLITKNTSSVGSKAQLSNKLNRFVSLYANASYTYQKLYTLSGSIRRDGSNIFGASTNDRWKPLWSAGAAWDLYGESFYHLKSIPFLKLSTTIGFSGNVDLSRTALPVASYGINSLNGYRLARVNEINNPGLSWEKSRQINFRLEFRTAKERITGSIEYYLKKGSDLYGLTPYDYTTWGFSNTITKNVADMKGDGFDIQLQSLNTTGKFIWRSALLLNINHQKTTNYYNRTGSEPVYNLVGGGTSINPVVGYPLYAIAAYRWGGLDPNGNPQYYIGDEKSTNYTEIINNAATKGLAGGSLVYKGSAIPTSFGALINSFDYKGFHLDINVGYKFGYALFKPTISYNGLVNNGIGNADFSLRWKKPGDELTTNVPSFIYPVNNVRDVMFSGSEVNVISGNHVRIQYLNLGYNLLNKRKLKDFQDLNVFINANNLGIIWKANKAGVDPDDLTYFNQSPSISLGIKTNLK